MTTLDEIVKEIYPFPNPMWYAGDDEGYEKAEAQVNKMREAFKMGAEWMAKQGNSFYYTLKGRNTIENLDMYALRKVGIEFGDRVLVQIKKV